MATGFADSAEVISAIDALAKEKKINKNNILCKIHKKLAIYLDNPRLFIGTNIRNGKKLAFKLCRKYKIQKCMTILC